MDISVIIPTHNRLWSLPKAIASCRNTRCQTEIIVVDDGSTDGTWEWLREQPNLVSIHQKRWGKPWAVNKAFEVTTGKYVKFLDSDDWLVSHSLDEQFRLAEETGADLVVAGYEVYEDDRLTRTQNWIECDDFIAQQLGECDSSHYSAFLFKRELISDIPHRTSFAAADFASRDDRCFMLEVSLREPKVTVMSSPALCHRHHKKGRLQFQNNIRSVATNLQHLLIYKNILNQLQQSDRLTQRRIAAAVNILWPLAHWIAKSHIREANELVNWIYQLEPNFKIPDEGMTGFLYRNLGFKKSERLFKLRRLIKYGWG